MRAGFPALRVSGWRHESSSFAGLPIIFGLVVEFVPLDIPEKGSTRAETRVLAHRRRLANRAFAQVAIAVFVRQHGVKGYPVASNPGIAERNQVMEGPLHQRSSFGCASEYGVAFVQFFSAGFEISPRKKLPSSSGFGFAFCKRKRAHIDAMRSSRSSSAVFGRLVIAFTLPSIRSRSRAASRISTTVPLSHP